MSKRPSCNGYNNFKFKKLKVEEKVTNLENDDIWGEDPDEDEVEECLLQATQASQISSQNTSVVPSYSNFKVPSTSKFYSSTQKNSTMKTTTYELNRPLNVAWNIKENNFNTKSIETNFKTTSNSQSTVIFEENSKIDASKYLIEQIEKLRIENEKLKDQCVTKEGEASILRNQLKQTRLVVDTVRAEKLKIAEKHHQEYTEKLCTLNKELNAIKTDTEFKDLEIVSLKERCRALENSRIKVIESPSQSTRLNSSFHKQFSRNLKSGVDASSQIENNCSQILFSPLDIYYPLKDQISSEIFEKSCQEKPVIDVKHTYSVNRSSLPILQYDSVSSIIEKAAELKKCQTVLCNQEPLTVGYVYNELNNLMKLTCEQLDSDCVRFSVNKIFFAAKELLLNSLDLVQKIKEEFKYEELRSLDNLYLNKNETFSMNYLHSNIYSSNEICYEENSIELRRILAVLAVISGQNQYISDHIIGKTNLITEDDLFLRDNLKYFIKINKKYEQNNLPGTSKQNSLKEQNDFLDLLHQLITMIGDIRRTHQFNGLLLSVTKLLINITHKSQDYLNARKEVIVNILKEIIFSRPYWNVLDNILQYFVHISYSNEVINLLCHNSETTTLKTDKKDGLTYFNKASCVLQIFSISLAQLLNTTKVFTIYLQTLENLVSFIHNGLSLESQWLVLTEKKFCLCFVKTVYAFVKCLQMTLELYIEEKHSIDDLNLETKFKNVAKNSLLLLYVLSFRKQEVICRTSSIIKQYHDVIRIFGQLKENLDLTYIHKTAYEEMYIFHHEQQSNETELSTEKQDTLTNILKICFNSFQNFD